MKSIPNKDLIIFKSCLVTVEYPGIESSTKYVFDKLGIDYEILDEQTCCTGLGHYSDIFDQFTTAVLGARNFSLVKKYSKKHFVMMCATCYAINKKVANILNNNEEVRSKVNDIFYESDLEELMYSKGDIDSSENLFHIVDIFYKNKDEISKLIKRDLSKFTIATHHGCHYCKVHYDDTIGGHRDPTILDELVESCGCKTIGFYDFKRNTCGSGFRQRYANKELSMEVTKDKLDSLKRENVDILVHLCPNCHVQFDRYQNYIDKDYKTIHLNIAQFIAFAMGADLNKVIGSKTHTVPLEPVLEGEI